MRPTLLHRMLREYSRRELPAWGRLLSLFSVNGARHDHRWQDAPTLTIRGKLHHYLMELDLSNWSDRHTYFLERFYDLATQLLLQEMLQPGDRVVDAGANTGMLTLLMARLVGPEGLVEAIEPNPVCAARISRALKMNQLRQVRLHVCALGAAEGEAILRQTSAHTGTATLGALPEVDRGNVHREFPVRVAPGDVLLLADARPVRLLKLDTEGYEVAALQGLHGLLTRDHPIVITEVDARWLARCGNSPRDLETLMRDLGYAPFGFTSPRVGLNRKLVIAPVAGLAADMKGDVLWTHPDTSHGAVIEQSRP